MACFIGYGMLQLREVFEARDNGHQPRLGALTDHFPFMLGDGRQNVNRKPIRIGHVAAHEVDLAFHQARNHVDVASLEALIRFWGPDRCRSHILRTCVNA
jgi:hypothetical protein